MRTTRIGLSHHSRIFSWVFLGLVSFGAEAILLDLQAVAVLQLDLLVKFVEWLGFDELVVESVKPFADGLAGR